MALTYEKFYGGVSNAEQLMYKKSCVYFKSKEGKLKWLVKKYLVEFFESKWDCGSFFNGA